MTENDHIEFTDRLVQHPAVTGAEFVPASSAEGFHCGETAEFETMTKAFVTLDAYELAEALGVRITVRNSAHGVLVSFR